MTQGELHSAIALIRQAKAMASGARALVENIEAPEDEHGESMAWHTYKVTELLNGADSEFDDAIDYLEEVLAEYRAENA